MKRGAHLTAFAESDLQLTIASNGINPVRSRANLLGYCGESRLAEGALRLSSLKTAVCFLLLTGSS